MGFDIRPASPADATQWLELVRATLGEQYPVKQLLDPAWIAAELDPQSGHETWVAEADGRIVSSVSFLKAEGPGASHVANLGRNLHVPESLADGSTEALLRRIIHVSQERSQMIVVRVSAMDNAQQILYENLGFVCVGYQPLKHQVQQRVGVLFYVKGAESILVNRLPISDSLPHVAELALATLDRLQVTQPPPLVRDGATGYPLQSELKFHDVTPEDYELWRMQAEAFNPPLEISGRFNFGTGHMRVPSQPMRAFLGQVEDQIVGGLSFCVDDQDRCVRINDAFASDDVSMGALLCHAVKFAEQQLGAVYTEVDVLASATRLLKTTEQLGFVPVAYLPAFFSCKGTCADVVKLTKLNQPYLLDRATFTVQAQSIVKIVDTNFQQEKMGLAIINLLRPLSIFKGLGDGELRKIAHLFQQKLYRANDQIFARGDSSNEAYIILRGQIDIQLEEQSQPVAILKAGKIFGELAFLDGTSRSAYAIARQPSILLVIRRSAFYDLIQREPHLGMVVMSNIAQDLGAKLREADLALKYRDVKPDL